MSIEREIRILILEDVAAEAELMERELKQGHVRFISKRIETRQELLTQLSQFQPDVILTDYALPQMDALSTLRIVREVAPSVPVIIVTDTINEEAIVECMKAGAADYLLKPRLLRLPSVMNSVMETRHAREKQKQAEEELERSLSLVRATLESTADGILVVDMNGKITLFNQRFVDMWRIPDSVISSRDDGQALKFVIDQLKNPNDFLARVHELYHQPDAQSRDILEFKDGRIFERYSIPQRIAGESVGRVWSFRDVTEQKRAEAITSALYRIAEITDAAEEIQVVYAAIHKIIGELTYAKNFYIALLDPESNMIHFPYFVDEMDASNESLTVGRTLTGYVLRTGQALLAPESIFNDMVARGEVELIGAPSLDWLGVPLKIGDTAFGALVVQSYTEEIRYDERDKDLLTFVSQHIATALLRKQSKAALRRSEEKYRTLFEESKDVIFISTPEGRFLEINPAGAELFGFDSREEVMKLDIVKDLYADPSVRTLYQTAVAEDGFVKDFEEVLKRKDGELITVLETSAAVRDKSGKIVAYRGIMRDITSLKQLQNQLLQSRKIETVGRLAAGVAHDFNNILMAIGGYCELIALQHQHDAILLKSIKEIERAAEQGANLTHQLLAFSRKQILAPKILNLNQLISGMEGMIRRLIGEDVEFIEILEPQLRKIKADPGQLEQVILNLAVNARDAMPYGGRLILETRNVDLTDDYVRHHIGAKAGKYVQLSISDTGVGMDEATRSRIFEPFFTTKEIGKGTGLGLATVYGIVKQSEGYITVYSEPGSGSTFSIYLPRAYERALLETSDRETRSFPSGWETILMVDDHEAVRSSISASLGLHGYKVLQAASGEEALHISRKYADPIHLLITDVVMPQMGGKELSEMLRIERPELKVLYISGYTEEAAFHEGMLGAGTLFLQKPASTATLLQKIRQLLA